MTEAPVDLLSALAHWLTLFFYGIAIVCVLFMILETYRR